MKKALATLTALMLFTTLPVAAQHENMSFFITSVGSLDGANLGGLEGADQHCENLAYAVGAGGKIWRAYLSQVAMGGQSAVNARDRIGSGPWYNYHGDLIAEDVTDLHSDNANLSKSSILTERGSVVNGRGDTPNTHDILTGSNLNGTVVTAEGHDACSNWTSNSSSGSAQVGHFDRTGGGQNPTSWNSAHASRGCSQDDLRATGGNGYFYCFAAGDDPAEEQEQQQGQEE